MNKAGFASVTYQLWNLGQITLPLWLSVLLPLNDGLANIFCNAIDNKYFRLCRHMFFVEAIQLCHYSAKQHRLYINMSMAVFYKTLCIKISSRLD